jgi:hypothetical protein
VIRQDDDRVRTIVDGALGGTAEDALMRPDPALDGTSDEQRRRAFGGTCECG